MTPTTYLAPVAGLCSRRCDLGEDIPTIVPKDREGGFLKLPDSAPNAGGTVGVLNSLTALIGTVRHMVT